MKTILLLALLASPSSAGMEMRSGGSITDGSVTAAKLADGAVTTAKLATDAVTAAAILSASVVTSKLATDSVIASKVLTGAITTSKLDTDAVTAAKILTGAVDSSKLVAGIGFNSGALFNDGSQADPSMAFISDRDTGLYLPGADNLGVVLAGTRYINIRTSDVRFVQADVIINVAASVGMSEGETHASTATLQVGGAVGGISANGSITQGTAKSCSTGVTTDATGKLDGCVASDRSLKTGIKSLNLDSGRLIDSLNPVAYKWNEKVNRDHERVHYGFIAQEVQTAVPAAAVSAGEGGLLGVDPNALLAVVVEELQALRKRVAELEKKQK